MLKYWVWLLLVLGPYNKIINDSKKGGLIPLFDDIEGLYNLLSKNGHPSLSVAENKRAKTLSLEKAEMLIEECESDNITIIPFDSQYYPQQLRHIYNPPLLLFAKGDISALHSELSLTVVGARNASKYSIKACKKICNELAKIGFTIVSGMAVGIDSAAHESVVEAKGTTISVLACGIKSNYPKETYNLRQRIINEGGVVVSELLPNSEASPSYFAQRNRIMSGLSLGTFIVQAGYKSGCMLTAEHAIEQGRDLFCLVPHDIFDGKYGGVVRYLRDGAIPVFSHLDVVYNYYTGHSHLFTPYDIGSDFMHIPAKTNTIIYKKNTNNTDKQEAEQHQAQIPWEELDEESVRLVKCLQKGEASADIISEKTGIEMTHIFELLIDLEINGIVKSVSGGLYTLV